MSDPIDHETQRRSRGRAALPRGPASRTVPLRLALPLSVAGLLSCDWITALGNDPPMSVGTIPDQVVKVDSAVVLDLVPHFDDPDGDSLTYTAGSAASVAASSVLGGMLTVTGAAKGVTAVTVTARDPEGLTATQSFTVTVPNRAPVVVDTIADGEVYVDAVLVIDAAAYFTTPMATRWSIRRPRRIRPGRRWTCRETRLP